MDVVRRRALMGRGGKVQLTPEGVTEHSRERSRFLIVRQGATDTDVLVLRLPAGQTALPVFDLEEEAGMFLWLEMVGEGWRVAEISVADLDTLLRDSCASVRRIVHPFVANGMGMGKGPATVDREDFLRTLSGERSRRKETRKVPPRISAWVGEDFW
jgi:hypothetical protein